MIERVEWLGYIFEIDKEWWIHRFADKSGFIQHNCNQVNPESRHYSGHVREKDDKCVMCSTKVPDFVWVAYKLGI